METSKEVITNDVFEEENPDTLASFVWYISLSCACVLLTVIMMVALKMMWSTGQKGNTQESQTYTQDPTVYVSPMTLAPPPKYESLGPPSYEDAMRTLSSNSRLHIQPILQPITTALAESLNTENSTTGNGNSNQSSTTGNNLRSTVIAIS